MKPKRLSIVLPVLGLVMAWSSCACTAQSTNPRILIVYYSEQGHTQAMAEAVADGVRSVDGVHLDVFTTDRTADLGVSDYDAIIIGTPVHNANVATPVQNFINSWPFEGNPMRGKLGAVFVTGGGISAGEELVQMNVLQSMLIFGMVVMGGPEWTSPFGASAVTNEAPFNRNGEGVDEVFLKKGRALGKRVAEMALKLKD